MPIMRDKIEKKCRGISRKGCLFRSKDTISTSHPGCMRVISFSMKPPAKVLVLNRKSLWVSRNTVVSPFGCPTVFLMLYEALTIFPPWYSQNLNRRLPGCKVFTLEHLRWLWCLSRWMESVALPFSSLRPLRYAFEVSFLLFFKGILLRGGGESRSSLTPVFAVQTVAAST